MEWYFQLTVIFSSYSKLVGEVSEKLKNMHLISISSYLLCNLLQLLFLAFIASSAIFIFDIFFSIFIVI